MKHLAIAMLLLTPGCATTAGATAMEVLAPVAVEALTALVKGRHGVGPDANTAGWFELPEGFNDDEWEYLLCRAQPIAAADQPLQSGPHYVAAD